MKILHTADWHLDAPLAGHSEENKAFLRQQLRKIPEKIANLCISEGCDLLIIAGDLFDGSYTRESLTAVHSALSRVKIPVVITPGNHDFCSPDSPYLKEHWPSNVHIFAQPKLESIVIDQLDCRIYGAGYTAMDCPNLIRELRADGPEKWHIGVFHGEILATSSYCP